MSRYGWGRLIGTMVLAHIADMWTTATALALGCHELNPLYGWIGYWGLAGMKVVVLTFIVSVALKMQRTDVLWLAIWAGVLCAVWNVLMFPFCGRV